MNFRLILARWITPPDHKVITRIPTNEMQEAGLNVIRRRNVNAFVQDEVFTSMWDAAPPKTISKRVRDLINTVRSLS